MTNTVWSLVPTSQVQDEALDLHHVGRFQIPLQFIFSQPHERGIRGGGGAAVGQNGFEEEQLYSNGALGPSGRWQFELVDSAGGVAEERRLEISFCEKANGCGLITDERRTNDTVSASLKRKSAFV